MPTFASPEELSGTLAAAAEDYQKPNEESEVAAARTVWSKGSIVPSFPFESEIDGVSPPGDVRRGSRSYVASGSLEG